MFPGYTLLASLQLAAVLGDASFINLHSNVDFDAKAFDLGFDIWKSWWIPTNFFTFFFAKKCLDSNCCFFCFFFHKWSYFMWKMVKILKSGEEWRNCGYLLNGKFEWKSRNLSSHLLWPSKSRAIFLCVSLSIHCRGNKSHFSKKKKDNGI